MKSSGNPGLGYTHFIGFVVPEALADTVEQCRRWMGERYGCRSGYRTVPHVTLVAPFSCSDERGAIVLENALSRWALCHRGFESLVEGFGSFDGRTIYARIPDTDLWSRWHDDLVREINADCPGMLPVSHRLFTPHLTVANRDIPSDAVAAALVYFSELDLHETFFVDHAALFEWGKESWIVRGQVQCTGYTNG